MSTVLARWAALVLGTVWPGVAWPSPLPETPVNSWVFIRNDNGAALFDEDTNSPHLGPPDNVSPNTLETAAIVGTWGGDISLQIGEVARITGGVAWSETGDGSSGLRFGLFNSDGTLQNGSPGYLVFLFNQTDNTFNFTRTASTAGLLFSPLGGLDLAATVVDEQGTWQDEAFSEFAFEVERTGSDSTEIRFFMSSFSDDPVNIEAVATHSAANGGAAARTFNFTTFGMQFSNASDGPDTAAFFNVNVAVSLSGDYNGDGVVNAADYVVWRKGVGVTSTQDNYNRWRTNFGRTAGGGGGSPGGSHGDSPVPEPEFIILGAVAIFMCMSLDIRRRSCGKHRFANI